VPRGRQRGGPGAAGHDGAVELDRDAAVAKLELLDQARQREPRGGVARLSVDENLHGARSGSVEGAMGIEPTLVAGKATVLPLNYARAAGDFKGIAPGGTPTSGTRPSAPPRAPGRR